MNWTLYFVRRNKVTA